MRSQTEQSFYFRGEKRSIMYLKIIGHWKRRDIGLEWELLAPSSGLLVASEVSARENLKKTERVSSLSLKLNIEAV